MRKINYDQECDILFIGFADMENSYSDEDESGIVIHRDIDNNMLTGVTIFDFSCRLLKYNDNPIVLPEGLDFNRDILPHLH